MDKQLEKAYEVMHIASDKIIGFTWGHEGGGLVYDIKDHSQIVGRMQTGAVRNEWILVADQPHHTGKRYTGDVVIKDNRPSRKIQ